MTAADPAKTPDHWYVYVLLCGDDSLYCGIARDVTARLRQHEKGTGARYTRGRGPLRVLGRARCTSHGEALRIEYAWKRLSRGEKLALTAQRAGVALFARRWRKAQAAQRNAR